MTKEQALKTFVDLFNNGSHQKYEDTRSTAVIEGDNVIISCANYPNKNYHIEDAAKIAQGLYLSIYARCEDHKLELVVF